MMIASREQQAALLSVRCTYCQAPPGQFCTSPRSRRRAWSGAPTVLTHLDGASHEARWVASGLREGASC